MQSQERSMARLFELLKNAYGEQSWIWFDTPQADLRNKTPAQIVSNSCEGYDFIFHLLESKVASKRN